MDYYNLGYRPIVRLSHKAGAIYKIGEKVLIKRSTFEKYLRENIRREKEEWEKLYQQQISVPVIVPVLFIYRKSRRTEMSRAKSPQYESMLLEELKANMEKRRKEVSAQFLDILVLRNHKSEKLEIIIQYLEDGRVMIRQEFPFYCRYDK